MLTLLLRIPSAASRLLSSFPSCRLPLIQGHTGPITDFDFDPFDSNLLTTGCDDAKLRVWEVPDGGLTANCDEPLVTVQGHGRKILYTQYHPAARNVLASASTDQTVKVWDLASAADKITITAHEDLIHSLTWNSNGSLLGTTCRDKQLRIIDPRSGAVVSQVQAHEGSKAARVVFLGKTGRLFTVGSSKRGERQFSIWDEKDMSKPLHTETAEPSPSVYQPMYDEDTGVMFLAAKGEAGIKYIEMIDDKPYNYFLSEFKGDWPQRGLCMLPKHAVDVNNTEIARFMRLSNTNKVESVSFTVPRKSEGFQADIFPDAKTKEAALTADEWFAGETKEPLRATMKPADLNSGPAISNASANRLNRGSVSARDSSAPKPAEQPKQAPPSRLAQSSTTASASAAPNKDLAAENARQAASIKELEAMLEDLKTKQIKTADELIAKLKAENEAQAAKIKELEAGN